MLELSQFSYTPGSPFLARLTANVSFHMLSAVRVHTVLESEYNQRNVKYALPYVSLKLQCGIFFFLQPVP